MVRKTMRDLANKLDEAVRKMTVDNFDPELFIGRWFLSKKPKDKKLYEWLAKKYPFKGRAWRLDTSPHNKPYASWCGTLNGIIAWKETMDPLGRTPPGWHVYSGTITKGIDLTKLVKDAKLMDPAAQRIVQVAEVVPIVNVKNMEPVYQ